MEQKIEPHISLITFIKLFIAYLTHVSNIFYCFPSAIFAIKHSKSSALLDRGVLYEKRYVCTVVLYERYFSRNFFFIKSTRLRLVLLIEKNYSKNISHKALPAIR